MTTHGCGHCHETFDSHDELKTHLEDCDREVCGCCKEEFNDYTSYLDHRPCYECSPVRDIEGEWRTERRKKERRRRFEEKRARDRRLGL